MWYYVCMKKFSGKIHIVYDGMWGSCGKGKYVGQLAFDPSLNISICVNNNAPNSGHSFVYDDGKKVVTHHIPIGFVNKNIPYLVIGESAVINYDILVQEMDNYADILNGRKIFICDTAAVILDKHKEMEKSSIKTGSTFSGSSYGFIDKILRTNSLVKNDERFLKLETEGKIKIVNSKTFFPSIYAGLNGFKGNENILVELSQGDALSINNSSNYPNTTSRDCTPAQALKDIHATDYSANVIKYCVFRPYPIRISNSSEKGYFYSGNFEGSKEITWKDVCDRCGLDYNKIELLEHTTVTKRLRRVAEFSIKQFAEMLLDTKPNKCLLNFGQYINGELLGISNNFNLLDTKTQFSIKCLKKYICQMEKYFNGLLNMRILNITDIGTGAKLNENLSRTKINSVKLSKLNFKTPFDYADKTNNINL